MLCEWGFLDAPFVLEQYFLRFFEAEQDKPLDKQGWLQKLALDIPSIPDGILGSLFRTLYSLSFEEPENPYGRIWSRLRDARSHFLAEALWTSNFQPLRQIVQVLTIAQQATEDTFPGIYSWDEAVGVVTAVITKVIAAKNKIAPYNPEFYTRVTSSVLQIILLPQSWYSGVEYWAQLYQQLLGTDLFVFEVIPEELRDSLLTEAIVEPSGAKPLNPVLAQ